MDPQGPHDQDELYHVVSGRVLRATTTASSYESRMTTLPTG